MRTTIAVLAGMLMLAIPAVASADWYMTKARAQTLARYEASKTYGSTDQNGNTVTYAASCRPQGISAPASGYIYHRWVCGWADDVGCFGTLLILGSHVSHTSFNYRVLRGQRCPTG